MPSAELIGACDKLSQTLRTFGVYKDIIDVNSICRRPPLNPQQMQAVISYLAQMNDILKALPDEELSLSAIRISAEQACEKFHMEFPEMGFLNQLEEGDIVEIFTKDHVQIFATPNIFKLTSYDIWTLAVIPWTELFTRPAEASAHLQTLARYLVESAVPFVKADVDEHVVREIYLNHRREFTYRLKCAGCLVEKNSRHVVGYASIISAQIET